MPPGCCCGWRARFEPGPDSKVAYARRLAKIANVYILQASTGKFAMPNRNINLTAVRRLQQHLQEHELNVHIKAGLDALERGAFTEIDDADLDATFDRLASARP